MSAIDTTVAARRVNGGTLAAAVGTRVALVGRLIDATGSRATVEASVRPARRRERGPAPQRWPGTVPVPRTAASVVLACDRHDAGAPRVAPPSAGWRGRREGTPPPHPANYPRGRARRRPQDKKPVVVHVAAPLSLATGTCVGGAALHAAARGPRSRGRASAWAGGHITGVSPITNASDPPTPLCPRCRSFVEFIGIAQGDGSVQEVRAVADPRCRGERDECRAVRTATAESPAPSPAGVPQRADRQFRPGDVQRARRARERAVQQTVPVTTLEHRAAARALRHCDVDAARAAPIRAHCASPAVSLALVKGQGPGSGTSRRSTALRQR